MGMLLSRSLLAGVLLLGVSYAAQAQTLTNGDFSVNGGAGQLTVNTTLSGWTGGGKEGNFGSQTTPPVFVFNLGTTTQLTSTGVNGDGFMGNVKFWSATAAPNNGVIIAADGDPDWGGSIQQTISGLTIGQNYTVSFNWAGAQQLGFDGNTTERWDVSLGSQTLSTSTVSTPNHGFLGWQTASLEFTADSTSSVLKFLAKGSPSGEPPWLLLNGVSLTSAANAPEPGALALAAPALTLVGGLVIRKRRRTNR